MSKKKIKKEESDANIRMHTNNANDEEGMDEIIFDEDVKNSDIGASGQMKKLREKLKKCIEDKQEYLDGWQRSKADFVNLKKEHSQQMERLKKFAVEDMVHDLLPVIESFDMAFANKEAWEAVDENWRNGIEHIHTQLMNVLEARGLKELGVVGEKFDHNIHDSVGMVENDDKKKSDTLAEVVQKGYELSGKVLRPAKVRVYN